MSDLVDGQLLKGAQEKLEEVLKQRLNKKDRLQYEVLQLIVLFIAEDHPKVREMYPVYSSAKWFVMIGIAAFTALLFTGRVMVSIVK